MMMNVTAFETLAAVLVFVLTCGSCLANPSNRSSDYDCLTGDACNTTDNPVFSVFRNQTYCCRRGDPLSLTFRGSYFSSSFFDDSFNNSNVEHLENNEDKSLEAADDNRRRDVNTDFKCTCGSQDYDRIRQRVIDNFRRWYESFQEWQRRSAWWRWW